MIFRTTPLSPRQPWKAGSDDAEIPTLFRRNCDTCLTPLQIRVEHLGERMLCPCCGHRFTAHDQRDAGPAVRRKY